MAEPVRQPIPREDDDFDRALQSLILQLGEAIHADDVQAMEAVIDRPTRRYHVLVTLTDGRRYRCDFQMGTRTEAEAWVWVAVAAEGGA